MFALFLLMMFDWDAAAINRAESEPSVSNQAINQSSITRYGFTTRDYFLSTATFPPVPVIQRHVQWQHNRGRVSLVPMLKLSPFTCMFFVSPKSIKSIIPLRAQIANPSPLDVVKQGLQSNN